MKESQKYLDKDFIHPDLGLVNVDGILSRVMVNITCIDKGKYWSEDMQRYVRKTIVKDNIDSSGKVLGKSLHFIGGKENPEYLHKDTCHIKELKPLNKQI